MQRVSGHPEEPYFAHTDLHPFKLEDFFYVF